MYTPSILQLCCFTNLWPDHFNVESWDLRLKRNIFDIPFNYPGQFDIVCAAPTCDQFTKANAHHWLKEPLDYIHLAQRCLDLCKLSGKFWFLENPPGRIEEFIPELKKYRVITWRSYSSNKEYVIYANFIITQPLSVRYGRHPIKKFDNMTKKQREAWDPALISDIIASISPNSVCCKR